MSMTTILFLIWAIPTGVMVGAGLFAYPFYRDIRLISDGIVWPIVIALVVVRWGRKIVRDVMDSASQSIRATWRGESDD